MNDDRLLRALGALLAFSAIAALPASAQLPSLGPLSHEEGGPLLRFSFGQMSETPTPVEPGRFESDLWLGYSNIFEQDSSATHWLFVDMERLSTAATVRYGLRPGLEVGGRLSLESTGGGVLDEFIVWWHDRLGLGNANRDRYPSDAFGERLESGDRVLIDAGPRRLALDDARLFAKWKFAESEDRSAVASLRAAVRIPVRATRVGKERTNVSFMVLARAPAARWYLHGAAGLSTVRVGPGLADHVRPTATFIMLGAERPLSRSLALIAQYSIGSAVLRGFHDSELDQPAANLVFGAAGRIAEAWRWELSFQEDLPADTPAVDFTLGIRVSRVW